MEHTKELQAIFNLHNGVLQPNDISEIVQRLWYLEDDYSEGSLRFHLALAKFPPPQPIDFYVMSMALINHREAHKVTNLLKLCHENFSFWKDALEMEASFKSSISATEAIKKIDESNIPFFQALEWLHGSTHLRRTTEADRAEIKKRLHKALGIFNSTSAFETGRTLLYLSQVESNYDTALKTAEQALENFLICKNKHYQSNTKLAIDSIKEKRRERRDTSKSRSIDLGFLIRPLIEAEDIETFLAGLIKVLTSRTFLALDHVTILYKGVGGEQIITSHHTSTTDSDETQSTIDLGCGYRLVVSQAADPIALEMILPLVKRELIRLSKLIPAPNIQYKRQFGKFTYYDSRMDEVLDLLEMAAMDQPESAIMLRGEPGVGKTDLAYALHLKGCNKAGKFVVYDAATAVEKSFMVAELFGTVKGAFTDAQSRIGKIEEAGHGTLFIDEIGELTPQCQAILLRVLQNREYQRMGAPESKPVNCRIILATNQPIEEWCQKTSHNETQPLFRPDLPSRFRHWIKILPLHEISDQIVPTALSFLREQGDYLLSPEAEIFLRSMRWIGNYRSLRNTIGLSVNMAKSFGVNVITPEIINRAIGHHPLLFRPAPNSINLKSIRTEPINRTNSEKYISDNRNPKLEQTVNLLEPEVLQTLKEQPNQYTKNEAISFSELQFTNVTDTRNAFFIQFKEVFDEFEYNRRKYFDFLVLSSISQTLHQGRFPRIKTFNLIYMGLLKSPLSKSIEGQEKVHRLGMIYKILCPKWTSPIP